MIIYSFLIELKSHLNLWTLANCTLLFFMSFSYILELSCASV